MKDNLTQSITGHIIVSTTSDDDGAVKVTASWEGGDVVGISKELLEDADSEFIQQEGDVVTVCQFRLKLIGGDGRTYLAQRMDD